jgi:hypothetical protein
MACSICTPPQAHPTHTPVILPLALPAALRIVARRHARITGGHIGNGRNLAFQVSSAPVTHGEMPGLSGWPVAICRKPLAD